jgi:D-alanine transaminase
MIIPIECKKGSFLDISFPYESDYLRNILDGFIEINGIYDAGLYIELTRRPDLFGEHRYQESYEPIFYILNSPLRNIDPKNRETEARVLTYPDLRYKLCEHKTI